MGCSSSKSESAQLSRNSAGKMEVEVLAVINSTSIPTRKSSRNSLSELEDEIWREEQIHLVLEAKKSQTQNSNRTVNVLSESIDPITIKNFKPKDVEKTARQSDLISKKLNPISS